MAIGGRYERPARSRVLEHDAFDDVRHVLAAVGGVLDVVVEVAPLHDLDRLDATAGAIQLGDAPPVDGVGLVLEAVDLDADVEQLLGLGRQLREQQHRAVHVLARLEEHARHLDGRGASDGDLEEHQPLGDGFDEVEHVVELRHEAVDVEPVERGDPRLVQPLERLVGDPVARAFLLAHVEREGLLAVGVLEHLEQQLRGLDALGGVIAERPEEDVVLGLGAEHCGAPSARVGSEDEEAGELDAVVRGREAVDVVVEELGELEAHAQAVERIDEHVGVPPVLARADLAGRRVVVVRLRVGAIVGDVRRAREVGRRPVVEAEQRPVLRLHVRVVARDPDLPLERGQVVLQAQQVRRPLDGVQGEAVAAGAHRRRGEAAAQRLVARLDVVVDQAVVDVLRPGGRRVFVAGIGLVDVRDDRELHAAVQPRVHVGDAAAVDDLAGERERVVALVLGRRQDGHEQIGGHRQRLRGHRLGRDERVDPRHLEVAIVAGEGDRRGADGGGGRAVGHHAGPVVERKLHAALAFGDDARAARRSHRREGDVDGHRVGLDRLGQADLRRAGVQLAGQALDLDGVGVVAVLPAEQVPVLAREHVEHRRLDAEVRVADAGQGAREERVLAHLASAGADVLRAQEVHLEHGARAHALGPRGLEAKAEARVADADLRLPVVAGVGLLRRGLRGGGGARHLGVARAVVEALGGVVDRVGLDEAVERGGPLAEDHAGRVARAVARRVPHVLEAGLVLGLADDAAIPQAAQGRQVGAGRRGRGRGRRGARRRCGRCGGRRLVGEGRRCAGERGAAQGDRDERESHARLLDRAGPSTQRLRASLRDRGGGRVTVG